MPLGDLGCLFTFHVLDVNKNKGVAETAPFEEAAYMKKVYYIR